MLKPFISVSHNIYGLSDVYHLFILKFSYIFEYIFRPVYDLLLLKFSYFYGQNQLISFFSVFCWGENDDYGIFIIVGIFVLLLSLRLKENIEKEKQKEKSL